MLFFDEASELAHAFYRSWCQTSSPKWVVLMRGLPGSGKTTFVEQAIEMLRGLDADIRCAVCSADDYFVGDDGRYRFDANYLSVAHTRCRTKFEGYLQANPLDHFYANVIFVDNTNITEFEVYPYVSAAQQANVYFVSMRLQCRMREEAAMQCLRSAHFVPLDKVLERYQAFTYRMDQDLETEVTPQYEDIDGYRLQGFLER